jgi:hypothetical protein
MDDTREIQRREEDRETESLLARISKVLERWKGIVIALGALAGAAAGAGSYLGAYHAIPTRTTKLEHKVDSGFRAIAVDIDTLRIGLQQSAQERSVLEEKIDLLLAINCPTVQRADLVRPCRPYLSRQ